MSENQNQLPAVDEAQAYVMQNLVAPAFFDKLAQVYGISPANEKQAQSLLQIGLMLQEADANPAIRKEAGISDNPYGTACNVLADHLGVKSAAENDEITKLASALAADPGMYLSALSIRSAEAAAN